MSPRIAALALVLMAACVVPPPLNNADSVDAGLNSIPVIVLLDSNYPSPGPIEINTAIDPLPMTLTVRDEDIEDDIFVFFYVDYNRPEPTSPSNQCQTSADERDRTLTCALNAVCENPGEGELFLEAMVADRDRLPTGEPRFRALPDDAGKSFQSWLLRCL